MGKKTKYKIGSGFAPLSPCADRFVVTGYRNSISLDEQIRLAAQLRDCVDWVGLSISIQR